MLDPGEGIEDQLRDCDEQLRGKKWKQSGWISGNGEQNKIDKGGEV